MKHTLLFLAIFVGSILSSTAQQNSSPETKFDMKNYYMVFLKKGPVRNQDSASVAKIQEQHLAHLSLMYEKKKMCIAGPFMEDGDIRGICVYATETAEEAKQLAEADPAVKCGRLLVEVHTWYAAKGSTLP